MLGQSTVPWWVPVLTAGATLAGVFLAGVLDFWRDHRQAARERARMLEEAKRSAYLKVLQWSGRTSTVLHYLRSGQQYIKSEAALRAIVDEAADLYAEVALFASEEAEEASEALLAALDAISRYVTQTFAADMKPGTPPLQTPEGKELVEALAKARGRFRRAAQKDLGLLGLLKAFDKRARESPSGTFMSSPRGNEHVDGDSEPITSPHTAPE